MLEQYNKFVKNAFRDFILPTIVFADIIIPGFRNNRVSVDFIVQHIKNMAMRITFKERAIKTKTFIFGESERMHLGSYFGAALLISAFVINGYIAKKRGHVT